MAVPTITSSRLIPVTRSACKCQLAVERCSELGRFNFKFKLFQWEIVDVGKLLFNHGEPESFTLVPEHWDSEVATAMTMNSRIATRTMAKPMAAAMASFLDKHLLCFDPSKPLRLFSLSSSVNVSDSWPLSLFDFIKA